MAREAYVYKLILHYLKNQEDAKLTKEISEAISIPYDTVVRVMRTLSKERRVRRTGAPGHAYKYEFLSDTPKDRKSLAIPQEMTRPPVDPISSELIQKITIQWTRDGWIPDTIEASQTLLTILREIYEFIWVQVNHGTPVDQSSLDHVRNKLSTARDKAFKFAEFFDRLLVTSELWNARTSAEFMLAGLEDQNEFIERAKSVSSALKVKSIE
jgi:hypothetical protein